jgi:hypothetical protein
MKNSKKASKQLKSNQKPEVSVLGLGSKVGHLSGHSRAAALAVGWVQRLAKVKAPWWVEAVACAMEPRKVASKARLLECGRAQLRVPRWVYCWVLATDGWSVSGTVLEWGMAAGGVWGFEWEGRHSAERARKMGRGLMMRKKLRHYCYCYFGLGWSTNKSPGS